MTTTPFYNTWYQNSFHPNLPRVDTDSSHRNLQKYVPNPSICKWDTVGMHMIHLIGHRLIFPCYSHYPKLHIQITTPMMTAPPILKHLTPKFFLPNLRIVDAHSSHRNLQKMCTTAQGAYINLLLPSLNCGDVLVPPRLSRQKKMRERDDDDDDDELS